MNASLLAKWRWRFLNGNGALWKEVLLARYGVRARSLLVEGDSGRVKEKGLVVDLACYNLGVVESEK